MNTFFCFRTSGQRYWVGIGWRDGRWQKYTSECWDFWEDSLWSGGLPPDGDADGHCVYLLDEKLHADNCGNQHDNVLCASPVSRKYNTESVIYKE